jgi:hypothetical protein
LIQCGEVSELSCREIIEANQRMIFDGY